MSERESWKKMYTKKNDQRAWKQSQADKRALQENDPRLRWGGEGVPATEESPDSR